MNKHKHSLITLLVLFTSFHAFAQELTQNIRGTIADKETKSPLVGATVVLLSDTSKIVAAAADINGHFRLEHVSVGRHKLKFSMIGYNDVVLSNIIVNSGKETVLSIELEESVQSLNEVTITATKKDEANNEMSSVSSKSFTIEETNRYAGSRSDPARMASNFAGVQGADDSRNDIVIRGNSPMGLLWRVEGVDIPNPNHFAVPGTTGGAISVLNNKIFGSSDFMTGAFPAEYGNANAGVFDIRIRNGNNEKHEFTAQLGFLGTELAGEGPLSKSKGSTYLFTYRYSTLKIFESFNFHIGTSAVPNYQDASFKLNFPTKKAGNFSLFAIGGISKIDIILSNKAADEVEIYGDSDRDQHFGSSMGVGGVTHSISLNEKTYLKTTIAAYGSDALADHDRFLRDSTYAVDTIFKKLWYEYKTAKYTFNTAITHKFNAKHSIKGGIIADVISLSLLDSNYVEVLDTWEKRNDFKGATYFIQPYFQWKYKPSDNLVINLGLHGQYYGLNGSSAIEPRAGLRYTLPKGQALSFGFGMHSQTQPTYIYFNRLQDASGNYYLPNHDLGFTRSMHLVAGYDKGLGANAHLRIETYYQHLYEIPVDTFPSSFSLVNQGSSFSRFFPGKLENTGTAENYGAEITLEKFFSKSYFFMITASIFDSKYKGSDKVERNTDYNGRFATNGLIGKEFSLSKKTVLTTGAKITWAGGKRYSPADTAASALAGELVEVDALRNTQKFHNYFRADLKIGVKINTKRLTHEIALDLVNILNTKNVLSLTYAPDPRNPAAGPFREEYQLGFLPLFYYRIDF
jgi:hypothetical protein